MSHALSLVHVVDPHLARPAGSPRPWVDVAVGVLVQADGRFLLTTRPPGKAYEGHWEFPGGKIEPGETVVQALARELFEELGITLLGEAEPMQTLHMDYPHALVALQICRVTQWQGDLQMKEGQSFAWERLPVQVTPLLAGTLPVLQSLAQAQSSISNSALPTAV